MPKISVIIPVYNVEPYLNRSLDSLKNQTFTDLEFICIDDCSTDNSLSILKKYEDCDSRFKVIALEKNCGAAVARNRGLDIASGEYLGFIDPDDEIDLNFYEKLYNSAIENNSDIAKCLMKVIDTEGNVTIGPITERIKNNGIFLFTSEWTTAIYRASIIFDNNIRFNEEIRKAQDIVFINKIVLKSKKLTFVDDVYYYYHRRDDSLDGKKLSDEAVKSLCLAISQIRNDIESANLFEIDSEIYTKRYMYFCGSIFYTLFKTDSFNSKKYCVDNIIEMYHNCKNKEDLEKIFWYKWMITYIEERRSKKLTKLIIQYDKQNDLKYRPLTFFEKIYKKIKKVFCIEKKH